MNKKMIPHTIGAYQLMSAALFGQQAFSTMAFAQPRPVNSFSVVLTFALALLNLIAGWKLLNLNKFGFQLSRISMLAQIPIFVLPFFLYQYTTMFGLEPDLGIQNGSLYADLKIQFFASTFQLYLKSNSEAHYFGINLLAAWFTYLLRSQNNMPAY